MKIDLKNIAVDIAIGALNIAASAAKEDNTDNQQISVNVSSDKVSASTNIEIKANKPQ